MIRSAPVVSPLGANSSWAMPFTPTSFTAQTIQRAKKTSDIASVRFRSALAPRKSGWSIENPWSVRWPQPIVPTPGKRLIQLAARMKMKTVAKNQKVRLTRCGPMMLSRNP